MIEAFAKLFSWLSANMIDASGITITIKVKDPKVKSHLTYIMGQEFNSHIRRGEKLQSVDNFWLYGMKVEVE